MDYTEIKKWLKENLSEERYFHTLGTAACAQELAIKYALDGEKAYLAGLLHDCAKCFSNEKLLDIINKNLDVEPAEMQNYKTLHAPVSAYIAQKEFNITDNEILSAIRWHTLGKLEMSDFEKIVFLADKIEPNTRDKEYCKKVRCLLKEDNGLNKAILKCYKETIKSLVKRDLKICLLTIEIYNKLQDLVQK
jgi:predicted HD superfamily hydrolase involved in NAD metabolism